MQGLMQDYPLTLPPVFERAARLYADKTIVTATCGGGVVRTTYADWATETRRLGGVLDSLGVSTDGRVGTLAWNTARHLALYWAAPCTGRILHTLNPRLFSEQLKYVINHGGDEVIFVDRSLLPVLLQQTDIPAVKHIVVMDDGADAEIPDDPRISDYAELVAAAHPVKFAVSDENQAAAMCYTSGTTGNPKGVLYSHRSLYMHALTSLLPCSLGTREDDTVLPVVPMFHANGWGFAQAPLFVGANLVLPGPDLSPPALLKLLETEKVTVTGGVPTVWMGLLPQLENHDLSALRTVICGGSAAPRALSEAFREKLGIPLTHAWGMTETSPLGSVCRLRGVDRTLPAEEQADLRARQGTPPVGVDARIVEPGSSDELPWDDTTTGELQVRGPWIAAAYYNDPASADSFTPDGWLRTGDVAAIDEYGSIRLVDRTKDLVKSGGEWISSVELENHLMAHPAVSEAAVIGVPHPRWQERPLACVVVADGAEVTKDELIEHLRGRVAKWWLPDDVVFIDAVPRTSVGKFSKKDLRARFADYQLPTT